MTRLAEVVTLYDTNAANVPAMLRQAADNIESETDEHDRTKAMLAVQVTQGGKVAIYGWGAAERFFVMGALQAALTKLADGVEEHEV